VTAARGRQVVGRNGTRSCSPGPGRVIRADALEPLLALLGLKQPYFFTRRFAELPQQIDTGPALDQISQLAQGMVLREVSVNDGPHDVVCTGGTETTRIWLIIE